jgi:hypothetical protein
METTKPFEWVVCVSEPTHSNPIRILEPKPYPYPTSLGSPSVNVASAREAQNETNMSGFEDALKEDCLTHRYPTHLPYRRSGVSPPQPGDIALCGWVKQSPPIGPQAAAKLPRCAQCEQLKVLGVGRRA